LVEQIGLTVCKAGIGNANYDSLEKLFGERVVKDSPQLRMVLISAVAFPEVSIGARIQGSPSRWEAAPFLVALLSDEWDKKVHGAAIFALSASTNPVAAQALLKELRSSSRSRRRMAIRGLRQLRAREAVPELIRALDDPRFGVRASAATALADIRDARAIDPLTELVERTRLPWRRALLKRKARELRQGAGVEGYA
jgi:HEAT repeat protein